MGGFNTMTVDISSITLPIQQALQKVHSLTVFKDLEEFELTLFGRNGELNKALDVLNTLEDKDAKRELGKSINGFKQSLKEAITQKRLELLQNSGDFIDTTLPGDKECTPLGELHMVTKAIEEITRIFGKIGFYRLSYPEIEWEKYAFESLNMPSTHPARDDFETFFIDAPASKEYGRMILTPHTSSGQVREMLRLKKPPIRMINIGRCYRPNWDVTHTPMFHQFEGLCIDKDISIKHLKGTISYFVKEFYGQEVEIRLRPYHFQFTEPSFEVDMTCTICKGTGKINEQKCKVCKSGWLELGGAGMVHPNVLLAGEINPQEYSGWAFGFGIERVYMMKGNLKLEDIRPLYSGEMDLFIRE